MIQVLVADDQAVVRTGIRMILDADDHITVVGDASDGREAIRLARELDPDVILMDIRMPVLDGIEATRRLAAEGARARILVLTTYGLDEYVYAALRAGAAGFMLKTDPPDRLVEAVRVVAAGDALLGAATTRRFIERFLAGSPPNPATPAELSRLTSRELDVLKLLARGMSNAEIGSALFIGEGTV